MDYSKIDLNKAKKLGRTLSGSEFEIKKWDEMSEGETWIDQMLFVGSKKVRTIHGEATILEFQHPKKPDIKRSIWGNTLIKNALESGDLFQADYMIYTIEYQGKQEKKNGKGNPYHVVEIYATDLRKMGFKSSEAMSAQDIVEPEFDTEDEIEFEDVVDEVIEDETEDYADDEDLDEPAPAPVKRVAAKAKPAAKPASKAKAKAKAAPARSAAKKKAVQDDDDTLDDLI